MRQAIWGQVVRISKTPEGAILPKWALAIRAVMFPLDSLYWWINSKRGYQFERDTWLIDGIEFSSASLRMLKQQQGAIFQITKVGSTLTFKRLEVKE